MHNGSELLENYGIKVLRRKLPDRDGFSIEELVFNYTDADYFGLISPEKVNEYQNGSITCFTSSGEFPLEVRTVYALYRGKRFYVTIVRFYSYGTWHHNSFGREIAENLSLYFGDKFYRGSDIYYGLREDGVVVMEPNTESRWMEKYWGEKPHPNPYVFCFLPGQANSGYYYRATRDKKHSGIPEYTGCPYGKNEEDRSQVDEEKLKAMKDRREFLNGEIAKIEAIPDEYRLEDHYTEDGKWDSKRWHRDFENWLNYSKLLKEAEKIMKRLDRATVPTTRERIHREYDEVMSKLKSNPTHASYVKFLEDKKKKANLEDELQRMKNEVNDLGWQISKEVNKTRLVPAKVCYDCCKDCRLYDFLNSLGYGGVVCKMSPYEEVE